MDFFLDSFFGILITKCFPSSLGRGKKKKKKVMRFLAGINELKARKMLASLLMEPTSSPQLVALQTTIFG